MTTYQAETFKQLLAKYPTIEKWHTGGGCWAYQVPVTGPRGTHDCYIMLTGEDDESHLPDLQATRVCAGYYVNGAENWADAIYVSVAEVDEALAEEMENRPGWACLLLKNQLEENGYPLDDIEDDYRVITEPEMRRDLIAMLNDYEARLGLNVTGIRLIVGLNTLHGYDEEVTA